MIVGNKLLRIILVSIFTILVIVNLVVWTTTEGIGFDMAVGSFGIVDGGKPTHYVGLKGIFDYIATFPGPAITLEALNTWCNVFTNFDVTGIAPLDSIIALGRLITGPVVCAVALVGDIFFNLYWLGKLIWGDWLISALNSHQSGYDMPIANILNNIPHILPKL